MFWREGNNPPTRLDKYRDACYCDAIGQATAWLPVQNHQIVAMEICRAQLKASPCSPPTAQLFDIVPIRRDATNATVVLEHKFGGQHDAMARPMEEFKGVVVSTNSSNLPRGFIRLRVVQFESNYPDGVYLSIAKHSPAT